MSRSFKKTAYSGDPKDKDMKRAANRKVRRALKQNEDLVLRNSDYKKLFESWDICDFGWISSWERYWIGVLRFYYWKLSTFPEKYVTPPDKEKAYQEWQKQYKRK